MEETWLPLVLLSLLLVRLADGISSPDMLILPDPDETPETNQSHHHYNISQCPIFLIVSYDGFRYDYFSRTNTPNFDWVKDNGVHSPYMRPQFPTKTFPNHHSIATGLHPESHGVVNNKVFDPIYGRALGVGDEEFWVYSRDVVPLWILNEWSGGVSGVMMWPGCCFGYGGNHSKPTYCVDWNPKVSFEGRIDGVVNWMTNSTNPANLLFLYFEEPDEHGHGFGPESPEVTETIERMDNVTGYLLEQLRKRNILEKVNIILLSDHGFQTVEQSHILNISAIMNPKRYQSYGGSPNYNIQPNPDENFDTIFEEFKNGSKSLNFTVYKKSEIDYEKPHWYYSRNRRISPIILAADLGYVFEDYNYNSTSHVYGAHGYDNHLMPMEAFFRGVGPVFKSGAEVDPFDNIDLFPLLCSLLQIPTPPHNGTILHVHNMLFRHGFHIGAPVGWVIGGGVLIGLLIIILILSLLVNRRRRLGKSRYATSNADDLSVGYRFVRTNEDSSGLVELVDTNKNGIINRLHGEDAIERRSLLLARSLSDESVSSQEAV